MAATTSHRAAEEIWERVIDWAQARQIREMATFMQVGWFARKSQPPTPMGVVAHSSMVWQCHIS